VKPNRIDAAFHRARAERRAALMPFLTAGDPDLATTAAIIEAIAQRGADVLELGIPYSDPIADGPTIQASFVRAMNKGVSVRDIFAMVRDVRTRCDLPILTMISVSIVSRIGPEAYCTQAAEAGIDGVIIPDLPVDEAAGIARIAETKGLHPVFLIAPTTPDARMNQIAHRSKGFIYYVSVVGVTGARTELPADLVDHLRRLRELTKKPVAVGFGIATPEQVRTVAAHADGAIVGSAIVRKVHENAGQPREKIASAVGDFVAQLASGTRPV